MIVVPFRRHRRAALVSTASAPPPSRAACSNVPVEITETLRAAAGVVEGIPHRFRRRRRASRRPRPGDGDRAAPRTCRSASRPTFDRVVFPARGRARRPAGRATAASRSSAARTLPPKAHSSIPAGERLRVSMPGGGGYGDPHKRPAAKVAEDVALGLVSVEVCARTLRRGGFGGGRDRRAGDGAAQDEGGGGVTA